MINIVLINGSGGVGKDEFIKQVSKNYEFISNYSSVDKIKEAAILLGWNKNSKLEKDRKYLSDLKLLSSEYCDLPFSYIVNQIHQKLDINDKEITFAHIREPEELQKIKEYYGNNCVAIIITNSRVKHITSNMADENVYDFQYDFVIENEGSLEELEQSAKVFVEWLLNN